MKYIKILFKVFLVVVGIVVLVAAYWVYGYTSSTGGSVFEPIIKEMKVCSTIPGHDYCSVRRCDHGYIFMVPGGAMCSDGSQPKEVK